MQRRACGARRRDFTACVWRGLPVSARRAPPPAFDVFSTLCLSGPARKQLLPAQPQQPPPSSPVWRGRQSSFPSMKQMRTCRRPRVEQKPNPSTGYSWSSARRDPVCTAGTRSICTRARGPASLGVHTPRFRTHRKMGAARPRCLAQNLHAHPLRTSELGARACGLPHERPPPRAPLTTECTLYNLPSAGARPRVPGRQLVAAQPRPRTLTLTPSPPRTPSEILSSLEDSSLQQLTRGDANNTGGVRRWLLRLPHRARARSRKGCAVR